MRLRRGLGVRGGLYRLCRLGTNGQLVGGQEMGWGGLCRGVDGSEMEWWLEAGVRDTRVLSGALGRSVQAKYRPFYLL